MNTTLSSTLNLHPKKMGAKQSSGNIGKHQPPLAVAVIPKPKSKKRVIKQPKRYEENIDLDKLNEQTLNKLVNIQNLHQGQRTLAPDAISDLLGNDSRNQA